MTELGIDGYDSAELIGRGGFGSVYRARQTAFNRMVAIKIFNAGTAEVESFHTFERECHAIGQLDWCPSIVTVFSSGKTSAGEPYIAMEYAPGGSLAAHIASAGPIEESAARNVLGRIALALGTAHEAGILHRDVKPANILISRTGEPILADFGIARLFAGGPTTTGSVAGTIAYAAPEIWLDEPATPQSDIFSLGATIHAALTGHGPFNDGRGTSTAAMMARVLATTELDVQVLPVSDEFRGIIGTCLRRKPASRFASAQHLLAALGAASSNFGPPTSVVTGTQSSERKPTIQLGPLVGSIQASPPGLTRVETDPRRWSDEYYQRGEEDIPLREEVRSNEVWPSGTDYVRLVQVEQDPLRGSKFAGATLVRDSLGMPRSASGQNAIVFEFQHGGGPIALRCFTRPQLGAAARYAELADFLSRHDVSSLVPSVWVPASLTDESRSWPVVVMPWVDGLPLNLALEDMLDRPDELVRLASRWREVMGSLVNAGIAHGDIQCGNVLVSPSLDLNLVDMDGVYAPGMSVPPAELGHPNFQHPGRARSHWGADADAFSFLVMAVSLQALAAAPHLWRHHNGENLILTQQDYLEPDTASVWDELAGNPDRDVIRLAEALREICKESEPPSLDRILELLGMRPRQDTEVNASTRSSATPTAVLTPDAGVTRLAPLMPTPPDETVMRSAPDLEPTVIRPASEGGAAPAKQWWNDEAADGFADSSAASTTAASGAPISSHAPAVNPLLRNAVSTGAAGGLLAGLSASALAGVFIRFLPPKYEIVLFLVLVGGLLSALLASMPSVAMRAYRKALRRAAAGFAIGGVISLIGLGLFQVLVSPSFDLEVGPAPFAFVLSGWLVTAISVGIAAGLVRRSGRAVLSGIYGGALGGLMGAWVHSLSTPQIVDSEGWEVLRIDPLQLGTLVPVLLACASIGAAVGAIDRLRRRHWLTVIEGRGRGLEVILDKSVASIGSDPACTLRIIAPDVFARHVELRMVPEPVLRVHGPVERAGATLTPGSDLALASGDVLRIGQSFVRFDTREGKRA